YLLRNCTPLTSDFRCVLFPLAADRPRYTCSILLLLLVHVQSLDKAGSRRSTIGELLPTLAGGVWARDPPSQSRCLKLLAGQVLIASRIPCWSDRCSLRDGHLPLNFFSTCARAGAF